MKLFNFLFLSLFLATGLYAQATMGIRENDPGSTPNELVLFYTFGADYNSDGRNSWNSQLVTLRYPATLPAPPSFIAGLIDENCFGWSSFSVGTCDGDHYVVLTDPDVATCSFNNGDVIDVLTISFDNTSTALPTADFELVPDGDACLTTFGFGAPAINNAATGANEFAGFNPAQVMGLALPVELVSFGVRPKNCKYVDIHWETELEEDNDFFTIQRSTDLVNWKTLKNTPSTGDRSKYSYRDVEFPSTNKAFFYRLGQTDYDGASTWLATQSTRLNCSTNQANIYPNPVSEKFMLTWDGESGGNYEISSPLGKVFQSGAIVSSSMEIDISSLPSGTYLIVLNVGYEQVVKRITKQ